MDVSADLQGAIGTVPPSPGSVVRAIETSRIRGVDVPSSTAPAITAQKVVPTAARVTAAFSAIVGQKRSNAPFYLKDVDDVHALLENLATSLPSPPAYLRQDDGGASGAGCAAALANAPSGQPL